MCRLLVLRSYPYYTTYHFSLTTTPIFILLNNPDLFSSLADHFHGIVDFLGLMGGCDGGPQACQSFRHSGRDDRQHEDVMVLGIAGEGIGAFVGTTKHWNDSGLGQHGVKTHLFQAVDELVRVLVQFFDTPGFVQDDLESFVGRRSLSGRKRRRARLAWRK